MSRIFHLRLVFWLTLGILLIFSVMPRGYAKSSETFPYTKTFVISSYYSPLPDQKFYVTGSFEGDVRLNGEGVHAADGTIVYPGMAAAPPNFPFGTKMEIPGFGTVAIHDRGGAIKNSRLDIWVGSGEEGLSRALGWGLRTVNVRVFGQDPNLQESVNFTDIPLADLNRIPVRTKYFQSDLALGDFGQEVAELQRFLKILGIFEGRADPPFAYGEETQAAVKKFQLDLAIIPNESDSGAGNFGPRSRASLEKILDDKKADWLNKLPSETLKKGDKNESVKNLQEILKFYNYLQDASGIFDASTADAIVRFQLDLAFVKNPKEYGAGFYGAKTQAGLKKLIEDAFTPETKLALPKSQNTPQEKSVFIKNLQYGDRGTEVAALQEELTRLNFFGLAPTGYFGKTTEHAVKKFQQAFGIVSGSASDGAGIVGPKSLEKLNALVSSRTAEIRLIAEATEQKAITASRLKDEATLLTGAIVPKSFHDELAFGTRSSEVTRLQTILKKLGFFPGRITTEYFGDITKGALLAFQKSHGIEGTGALNTETRRIMNQLVLPQAS